MFDKILVDQNHHWRNETVTHLFHREKFNNLVKYLEIPQIIAVTGIRRCGKSTLLKQTINYLINIRGVPPQNILFLNLEQPYLLQFSDDINNLEKIFDNYLSLNNPKGKIFVLLDEVQFFKNWPVFVKSHYESKYNNHHIKFIITGSNSKLLSSDMVTLLSGRSVSLELYPLTFCEIIEANNLNYTDKKDYLSNRHEIKNILSTIIKQGSFPEIVGLKGDTNLCYEILSSYAKTIVLQDIAPRLNVRKTKQLEELFNYLITNISALTTYNKLSNYFSLSDKSIKEYINAFSDAYLLFELEQFSYSAKPTTKRLKKIYSIDTGLANACGLKFTSNNGKLLENLVFADCKQRDLESFFYRTNNGLEVDFVIKDNSKIMLIQVAWQILSEETFRRELRALSTALDELNCEQGFLITMDDEIKFEITDFRIRHVSAFEWFLRNA